MLDLLLSPLVQIVALGVAGISVWHLQGRRRPNARLVVQIAFFTIMTAILVGSGIAPQQFQPFQAGGYLLIVAKLLWWVHLAWALIGFVRIYIVLDGRPREARLLQDLIVAAVYLGVTLSILSFVFGIAIGTLVATSGVIAIILGLALQSTLNDLFSGLALTLGRPYGIGDWIMLTDGTEGRVVESTWRSTHIKTAADNIVVLPNSVLAKIGLTNISRPDEMHQLILPLRLKPTRYPSVIVEAMRQALMGCNSIVHDPAPLVALIGMDAVAMELELQFLVRRVAFRIAARNEVIDLVHRQCAATGIPLALPASLAVAAEGLGTGARLPETLLQILRSNPIFADVRQSELLKLEAAATMRQYRPGDPVLVRTSKEPTLMVVRSGAAAMMRADAEVLRLGSGAIVVRVADDDNALTFKALTVLQAYELDSRALEALLRDNPVVQDELSLHLANLSLGTHASGHSAPNRIEHSAAFLRTIHSVFRR
ncbi:small mechanosensitive ion channel [Sinorhizobium glycinis]|uniref:Small-conductance mechanosensitive channel n=1 Tax=Sinorhizobium glycinis TaxID=1472378 RepID=A0A178XMZ7_9HYPH|nr:mechanosensitive ion channel domain-containing protein [Sinorhizobium glycinis]OAP36574.1 small mechanosensitive ion channel [Sinorhizobium glycinis]